MNSMERTRRATRNILVWSYERGTLQYDVICALILAFVFLVPKGCFVSRPDVRTADYSTPSAPDTPRQVPAVPQKQGN